MNTVTRITLAQPGFANRRAKWRVAIGTAETVMLDARTTEAKRAGVRVEYVRGTREDAERTARNLTVPRYDEMAHYRREC